MIGPAVAREGDVGRHSQPRHRAQRWDRQLLIECHQLAHASEVVVADEKDDLVREVITHRHDLDVRAQPLFGSSDLHSSRSTGQMTMTRASSIDGVEFTLASPDTHGAAWVD